MICTKENRYGGKLNKPGDPMTPAGSQARRLILALGWGRDETPEEVARSSQSATAVARAEPPVVRSATGQYKRRDMRAESLEGTRTPVSTNKRPAAPPAAAPAPAPAAAPATAGKDTAVGAATAADFKAPDSSSS